MALQREILHIIFIRPFCGVITTEEPGARETRSPAGPLRLKLRCAFGKKKKAKRRLLSVGDRTGSEPLRNEEMRGFPGLLKVKGQGCARANTTTQDVSSVTNKRNK